MKPAPTFTLPDQHGRQHSLAEYAGKWLVIYFYPQDETPGCTEEACVFRDGRGDLVAAGAEVIGISADTVESHKQFADKHSLNFTILADPKRQAISAYGAWDEAAGRTLRNTYLVNPAGQIVKTYKNVSPTGHAMAILEDITQLSR